MSRSSQFTFVTAGLRPPAHVVERLQRFHPNVKLVWNTYFQRWALMERGILTGDWEPIYLIHGPKGEYEPPTVYNTVFRLNEMDVRTFGYWEKKKWLDQLDHGHEEPMRIERDRIIRDICRDMVDRVWHDRGKRIGVRVDGSADHSKETC